MAAFVLNTTHRKEPAAQSATGPLNSRSARDASPSLAWSVIPTRNPPLCKKIVLPQI
jgi:hypothetical protein